MNMYQEVSDLLNDAENYSQEAKVVKRSKRNVMYVFKHKKIAQAVIIDPNGWWMNDWDQIDEIASITYRGCWWFHIAVKLLSPVVLAYLLSRNVAWFPKDEDEATLKSLQPILPLRHSRDIWQSLKKLRQGYSSYQTSSRIWCKCGEVSDLRAGGNCCCDGQYTTGF